MILDEVTKKPKAKGIVISVGDGRILNDGTRIEPNVEVGDVVVFNPHLIGHELEESGEVTLILSSNAIYGKYQ